MITSFSCNKEKARSVAGFAGINHTGKYVGIITQAEVGESKGGATFIEIAFKAKSWEAKMADDTVKPGTGDAMCFIKTYITSKTGERIFGHDIIDALMAVLKIDNMNATKSTVYGRNWKNDHKDQHDGYRIPALEKQRVGLLLQREDRERVMDDGTLREWFEMRIITPYDPDTMKNAKEILNNEEAYAVESRFKTLRDKPVQKSQSQASARGGYQPSAADTAPDYDDIPL